MKTFAFDSLEKYSRFSDFRNIKKSLCNKPWQAFSDADSKETYTFMPNGTLIIAIDGNSLKSTWQYDPKSRYLTITGKAKSHVFRIVYYDNALLAIHIEGSSEYAFFINTGNEVFFSPKIYSDIITYLRQKEIAEDTKVIKLANDFNFNPSQCGKAFANKVAQKREQQTIKSEASIFRKRIYNRYRSCGKIAVKIICCLVYIIYFCYNYFSSGLTLGEAVIDALFYGTIINLLVCALCINLLIAKVATAIHLFIWKKRNPKEKICKYL